MQPQVIQQFITNNNNFQANRQIEVRGLMVHGVGVPQPDPKVFVRNFNVPRPNGRQVGVHGFMGEDGILYQTLPWNHRAWHCGSGANGSGNDTHIGIEITEPNTIRYTQGSQFIDNNPARTLEFVLNTYRHAVKHFAALCLKYKLNPLDDGVIISHAEGHRRGIASNHGDIDHIWNRNGLSMNQFRQDIADEIIGKTEICIATVESDPSPITDRTIAIDIFGDVQEIRGFIENGETFVRLTEYSAAKGYSVSWDNKRRIPVVRKPDAGDAPPCYDDTPLYTISEAEITQGDEDMRLLKIITHWEARGEDEKGQILVVNVIKNRLASRNFPDTLHDVIFAPNQFTPTTRADFNDAQPDARTVSAVSRALSGEDFSQGATFFHSISGIRQAEREGRQVWHERAVTEGRLVHLFDHGNHRFYREV